MYNVASLGGERWTLINGPLLHSDGSHVNLDVKFGSLNQAFVYFMIINNDIFYWYFPIMTHSDFTPDFERDFGCLYCWQGLSVFIIVQKSMEFIVEH